MLEPKLFAYDLVLMQTNHVGSMGSVSYFCSAFRSTSGQLTLSHHGNLLSRSSLFVLPFDAVFSKMLTMSLNHK